MKLTHLMTNRVMIARKVATSGDKMAFTTVTSEMMHIQPTSDSSSEIREGVFGKQFRIYCDGSTNLRQGDRLRDEEGNYYTVVSDGVSRRTYGSIDYLTVFVQKTQD